MNIATTVEAVGRRACRALIPATLCTALLGLSAVPAFAAGGPYTGSPVFQSGVPGERTHVYTADRRLHGESKAGFKQGAVFVRRALALWRHGKGRCR
jgi:hypothetical protein